MRTNPPEGTGSPRRDTPAVAPDAGVSFVMPVLNEAEYLEKAVASTLAQEVPGPVELVLALGPSSDGTTALAERLAADDARIVLVRNPEAHIPVGLNAAIQASHHPTIIRVDAHSELSPGYAARALDTLTRTGAGNVGGVMSANGRSPFQRAVAWAYNSPVGLGGAAYHSGQVEGEAESAYLGVLRRSVLDEVGGFDESVRRGEDWELNLRIRGAGYRVWFDPALSVTYWPRESWTRLAQQFFATGQWRGELFRRFGRRNGVKYLAPPALLISVMLAAVCGTAALTLRTTLALVLGIVTALPVAAYAALVSLCAATTPGESRLRLTLTERCWLLAVLPTMHLAWGAGFLLGAIRGAQHTVDTSRLSGRNTPLP